MPTRSIYLLHDNAGVHTARATKQLLHSLDLAPSDFHLFLHLKKHLAGQKLHENEEVKNEVPTWLRALAAELYDIVIQKQIPRRNKCRDKGGDYVVKYIKVCVRNLFNLFR